MGFKKKKFLNKALQSRYMLILVASMVVPTLIVGACLYYLIFSVMADQLSLPDVIARDLYPVIDQINLVLVVGLPVVFVVLISWAVVLSFRFVGPLERLEEDIRRIDEGDYSVRLQINSDHDLSPIGDVINDLVGKLEQKEK